MKSWVEAWPRKFEIFFVLTDPVCGKSPLSKFNEITK